MSRAYLPIAFELDDAKAASNLAKHRIAFQAAVAVFADPNAVMVDTVRAIDGESRRKVIGRIQSRLFTVVYVVRSGACRLISARRANASEERAYGTHDARP